jgi:hypothetical protein
MPILLLEFGSFSCTTYRPTMWNIRSKEVSAVHAFHYFIIYKYLHYPKKEGTTRFFTQVRTASLRNTEAYHIILLLSGCKRF